MRALLLAGCLLMSMTISSAVVAEEKESFTFKVNDRGEWCGKFYTNHWSDRLRYACKSQKEWERLGVNFPKETPRFEREAVSEIIFGSPILNEGKVSLRG
tara:strand:- start:1935 stop:2234 length:300 start_codon:yes stop_codon:yes gene_type:complete